ncbi:VPLPA-CTERM sorting domain-containing protein [Desulfovibrio inopinatus]|uniref:VPLPA-CTERM sorting domain-containing protein n=1 Tax=Desulfovibrio inopinatus TaxID=102109 RepID=UPI0003F8DC38|nr:VPLPA-CTERM sorting domain-containing protein [Desulfovibrio inopinatus]
MKVLKYALVVCFALTMSANTSWASLLKFDLSDITVNEFFGITGYYTSGVLTLDMSILEQNKIEISDNKTGYMGDASMLNAIKIRFGGKTIKDIGDSIASPGWTVFTTDSDSQASDISYLKIFGPSDVPFHLYYSGKDSSLLSVNDTVGSLSANVSSVSAVPLPAGVWLFGSAMLGLVSIRRKVV